MKSLSVSPAIDRTGFKESPLRLGWLSAVWQAFLPA